MFWIGPVCCSKIFCSEEARNVCFFKVNTKILISQFKALKNRSYHRVLWSIDIEIAGKVPNSKLLTLLLTRTFQTKRNYKSGGQHKYQSIGV